MLHLPENTDMTDTQNASFSARNGRVWPRRSLLVTLGLAVGALVFFVFVPPNWLGNPDDAAVVVHVPRVSVVGFELVERDAGLSIVARLKNTGKAAATDVSITLQQAPVPSAVTAKRGAETKSLSLGPDEEASYDLGLLSEYLLDWQGRCAGCYFLGLGKGAILPVEVIATTCKGLMEKGKQCRLDYRLLPTTVSIRFALSDGVRIEGLRPIFVYLSQTAETPHRIPKY